MRAILAVGEVLWDVFPDGPRFGGAPANFACAAAGLGGPHVRVALASAVGGDALGDEARRRLTDRGVSTALVPTVAAETGQVLVSLDPAGKASYRFIDDPAWDHLAPTPHLLHAAATADVVYFGTLGQRATESRETVLAVLNATRSECLRVLDINLRPPHWSADVLRESLALANVVKMNDEELPLVAGVLGVRGDETEVLNQIRSMFNLKVLALTRGALGSRVLAADGTADDLPAELVPVADTVGAGDAFTAALALGLAFGHPLARAHRAAAAAAAFVCTQPGGTPAFPPQLLLAP